MPDKIMTIPEVRVAIAELVERFDRQADELHACTTVLEGLIEQLYRRRPVTKAPITSRPATAALSRAIRVYHAAHPDMTQQAVGVQFHVTAGRVSEALAGKRGA